MKYSPGRNGFYSPDLEAAYRASGSWPDDLVEVSDAAYAQIQWELGQGRSLTSQGGAPVTVETVIAPTARDVNRERKRRIEAGVLVAVTGGTRPVALQGRAEDQSSLMALALAANLRIAAGRGSETTTFRDRDNIDHELTQSQVLELWQRGAAWIEAVYAASWALKDQNPIPQDFTHDIYWAVMPENS